MKNPYIERLYNGLIKENPVLVLMLGMCPTLAVSTKAMNGVGMGISTLAVLASRPRSCAPEADIAIA
ncbi:MAG: hypothetical protein IIY77_09645 [Lachnospiraceae bacterium]|nr:hypothetical protein [Lachnospiraceae bacterium]